MREQNAIIERTVNSVSKLFLFEGTCQSRNELWMPEVAAPSSYDGRLLVLRQRSEEEELGGVQVLGSNTVHVGSYSYRESSPFASGQQANFTTKR
ncbi:MAG TPA: hypothetical protein VFQ23_06515 [Anaerolineales bacterium]|nr:hypothetical protein [Anaerolineales bacterium]